MFRNLIVMVLIVALHVEEEAEANEIEIKEDKK